MVCVAVCVADGLRALCVSAFRCVADCVATRVATRVAVRGVQPVARLPDGSSAKRQASDGETAVGRAGTIAGATPSPNPCAPVLVWKSAFCAPRFSRPCIRSRIGSGRFGAVRMRCAPFPFQRSVFGRQDAPRSIGGRGG